MIIPIAFILGALVGFWRAKSKGKPKLDIAQYAVVHGIFFCLVALVAAVVGGIFISP